MRDKYQLLKYAVNTLDVSERELLLMKNAGIFTSLTSKAIKHAPWAKGILQPSSKLGRFAKGHLGRSSMLSGFGALTPDEKNPNSSFLSRFGKNMTDWRYHAAAGAMGTLEKPVMNFMGKRGLQMTGMGGKGKLAQTVRGLGGYVAATSGEAAGALKQVRNAHGLGSGVFSNIFGIGNKAKGVTNKELGTMAKELLGKGKKVDATKFFNEKGFKLMDEAALKSKGAVQDFAVKHGVKPNLITDEVFKGGKKNIHKVLQDQGIKSYSTHSAIPFGNVTGGSEGFVGSLIAPVGTMSLATPLIASGISSVPGVGEYAARPLETYHSMWEPEKFAKNLTGIAKPAKTMNRLATFEGSARWKNKGGRAPKAMASPLRYFGR